MIKNIKVLVIEDEILIAEYFKILLAEFEINQIELAHKKEVAIEKIELFKPDLILLDIHLKKSNEGLEIGILINEIYKIPFIYITSYSDIKMLSKIIETNPFSYLTKPIKKNDLFIAIDKVAKEIQSKQIEKSELFLKDGHQLVKIKTETIKYISSSGNYIFIHTDGKKYCLRYSLDWVHQQLCPETFIRVHRCYLVNKKSIEKISTNTIFVLSQSIPVSRTKIKEIKAQLT
jgi:two-component system, LytTR family, response regulator LytT